jgi:hypothetical protein
MDTTSQRELKSPGPLLNPDGTLADVGWSRQPLLDCNLESVGFYKALQFLQPFRVKRWDYYGLMTPTHYFAFTLAHLGYLGTVFSYAIDRETGKCHEESLVIPLGRGIQLPRNSTEGESHFADKRVKMHFSILPQERRIAVEWPGFEGKGLSANLSFALPPEHESMVIVIPIRGNRFYYNRKVNCMPASGTIQYGDQRIDVQPNTCLGNLDWGRGVWQYNSFWVWTTASGFEASTGRRIGLNLGFGFGDTSAATENALILDGRIHKLGQVKFTYNPSDLKQPWQLASTDKRLSLVFTPFFERVAKTNLVAIKSEMHQILGRYSGTVVADDGNVVPIDNLIGFVEEHYARW